MNIITEILGGSHNPYLIASALGAAGIAAAALMYRHGLSRRWIKLPGDGTSLTVGMPSAKELGLSAELGRSFEGFVGDVMTTMGARLDRDMTIKQVTLKEYEQALKNKDVDLMMLDGDAAVSHSNAIEVVPCHTAALSSLALVFWDKMPHHVDTLQDFSYYTSNSTVVLRNSLEEHYLANFDGIRAHRVDSITKLIVNLKLGLARAGLMRMEHAHVLKREYNNLKYVPISLQKRCVIQDEKIGVLRENQDLSAAVEHTLAGMRADETMRRLHGKWFGV